MPRFVPRIGSLVSDRRGKDVRQAVDGGVGAHRIQPFVEIAEGTAFPIDEVAFCDLPNGGSFGNGDKSAVNKGTDEVAEMLLRAGPFDLCMGRFTKEKGCEIIGACVRSEPLCAEQMLVEMRETVRMPHQMAIEERGGSDRRSDTLGRLRSVGLCRNGRRFYDRCVFGDGSSTDDALNSIHVFLQCTALRGCESDHTIKFYKE